MILAELCIRSRVSVHFVHLSATLILFTKSVKLKTYVYFKSDYLNITLIYLVTGCKVLSANFTYET